MTTAHAVTRSVRDSAALLDATQGPDLGAPYHAPPPERPYLEEVGRDPGRLRIAFQRGSFNGREPEPDCAQALESALALCESLGHEVFEGTVDVDREALARAGQMIIAASTRLMLEERAAELERELAQDDVEPMTWGMTSLVTQTTSAVDYARAIRTIHAAGRRLARFFLDCDVLLTPTMACPPTRLGEVALTNPDPPALLDRLQLTIGYTQLMNAAGNPAMSVPLHWSAAGLPIGVQFAAPFGDEATLFRLAAQLEQARPWYERRPPL